MEENLLKKFELEFRACGWINEDGSFKDEMQKHICEDVIELLEVFHNQGHSGSSAPYTIDLFEKLALFKSLTPLTGEDWEWTDVSDGVFQNKRASHVFKSSDRFDGKPYDINAEVFWEWCSSPNIDNGKPYKSYYTSRDSFHPIEFPYTPTTKYTFKPTEQFPNETL